MIYAWYTCRSGCWSEFIDFGIAFCVGLREAARDRPAAGSPRTMRGESCGSTPLHFWFGEQITKHRVAAVLQRLLGTPAFSCARWCRQIPGQCGMACTHVPRILFVQSLS